MNMSMSMSGTNVYEAARLSGGSSILENLQSQLKLREGEIAQLQVGLLVWATLKVLLCVSTTCVKMEQKPNLQSSAMIKCE